MSVQHFVSFSGGKDSTATYLKAIERGRPFRAVFADTGNEHPKTLDFVRGLAAQTGGPEIEWVCADFSAEFEERREYIRAHWCKPTRVRALRPDHRQTCPPLGAAKRCTCPLIEVPPVPEDLIQRAVAAMHPSGNPFLDLCMLKGRFPGAKTRFCTVRLKLEPMDELKLPILYGGTNLIEWIGERAEESEARRAKPRIERIRYTHDFRQGGEGILLPKPVSRVLFRPIHTWTADDVFALHRKHGVSPNPLYLMGMGRVGCMPCIMVKKAELNAIAKRFPEQIDRIEEWEAIVTMVSKRGAATFFCAKMLPGHGETRARIRMAVEWARTGRGGRNFDLFMNADEEDPDMCQSAYGLCE